MGKMGNNDRQCPETHVGAGYPRPNIVVQVQLKTAVIHNLNPYHFLYGKNFPDIVIFTRVPFGLNQNSGRQVWQ